MFLDLIFEHYPLVAQSLISGSLLLGIVLVWWGKWRELPVAPVRFALFYLLLVVLGLSTDLKYVSGIGVAVVIAQWWIVGSVKRYFSTGALALLAVPALLSSWVLILNHGYTDRGLELMGHWQGIKLPL